VLARHEADEGHELARRFEAHEVLQLGDQSHRGNQLHAAHAHQRLHPRPKGPVRQRVAHRLLEPLNTSRGLGDRVQVFLEADLLRRVLHLRPGQPAQVRGGPAALARVGDAVAQQQRLEPVARRAALAHTVVASAHQVTNGLVGCTGYAHRGEISRSVEPGQRHRVATLRLDAIARALGNGRRRHDVAR
jgi:hypothetical protein